MIGAKTPDYRGLFLRGHGAQTSTHYGTVTHQSGALGVLQGDAIRDITGSMRSGTVWGQYPDWQGAMSRTSHASDRLTGGGVPGNDRVRFDFKASRVVPVAEENRPVNTAVRYFIRARL